MEKKYDVEIIWSEIVKMLKERHPGKAYGSYILMPKEVRKVQRDEVNDLLKMQAELTAENIIEQVSIKKTVKELMEDIELVSIEKHGVNLVGWILVI